MRFVSALSDITRVLFPEICILSQFFLCEVRGKVPHIQTRGKRGRIILVSGACHCHSKTLEKCILHNKGPLSFVNRKGKVKREQKEVQSEEIKQDSDFVAGLSENTECSELLVRRWRT